ncbi:MAG TPA: DNA replication/repair protein RecF [Dehalococcoidia bacterium]|nr:DNA replication/repair protein RecF [Dehalococcoidia bacterium]
MHIRHLSLSNFRNYRRLELDPPTGLLLFLGQNAQGKTNLLEAVHLLSTIRSPRATSDADLIHWEAPDDGPPIARLVAEAERGSGEVRIEMTVRGPEDAPTGSRLRAGKRLRLNGLPQRASQVVGRISSVFFTPQDLDLIGGPPSLRRRFLDITLSQADSHYLAALQEYTKVVVQRNALLRRIREGVGRADELTFWESRMAESGAYIAGARSNAIGRLAGLAAIAHGDLSSGQEDLRLVYEPRWAEGWSAGDLAGKDQATLAAALLDTLSRRRQQEIGAGASLWGPHRDDLLFLLDGRPAAAFASRAQWRTAALALRLAEARFLLDATGDHPVLLLDDVLSEMDEARRHGVLDALSGFDQVWITSAEEQYVRSLVPAAHVFIVRAGEVSPG